MKTTTNQLKQSSFPAYHLLPWEVEWSKKYADLSVNKFKNNTQTNIRTEDKKFLDAYCGVAGELGFRELLNAETKNMLKEWASGEEKLGCEYDFLFDNGANADVMIDVKTAGSHSEYVHSPEECNFFYSKSFFELKESRNIKLCDIYIQMFYDIEKETAYFIGAVSLNKLKELGKIKKEWNGGIKILKSEMDCTNKWLPYLNG